MRNAFVVQLGTLSQPAQSELEGWVEEVDSGQQFRFRSTDELLTFLSRRMQAASEPENDGEISKRRLKE